MNVKEARERKGLTQNAVAEMTHIAQNSYSSIENGKRKPSVKVAKRIAAVLGFNWTQFFEDGDSQTENDENPLLDS